MAIKFDPNALIEEFKRTNWKDAGTWHVAPKLLVLFAILVGLPAAGYMADTKIQLEELEIGRAAEVKLKDQYLAKKKQAVNLDLHRQQLREIDTQFGALLRQLPNRSPLVHARRSPGSSSDHRAPLARPEQRSEPGYWVENDGQFRRQPECQRKPGSPVGNLQTQPSGRLSV